MSTLMQLVGRKIERQKVIVVMMMVKNLQIVSVFENQFLVFVVVVAGLSSSSAVMIVLSKN